MFLFIFEKNIPHWHRLLLITNWFIYPFGSFLHHLVTYSNLFNPTSSQLTKFTQKLYTTFPLKSKTLHKHSKPMHTALPQPPSPFFFIPFKFCENPSSKSFPQVSKNCLPFLNPFSTFLKILFALYT